MEHDPGRTAMWVCSALVGLLRHKGVVVDAELLALADSLGRSALSESAEQRADMLRAADWLRHSVPAAND